MASARPLPDAHVLVVDDNSRDGTGEIADALAGADDRVEVLHRPGKAGLGRAYTAGFAYVAARRAPTYVVEMDADLSHDPADLPRLIAPALEGADLVLGSRYVARRRDRELGPAAARHLARGLPLRPPRARRRRARPDRRLQVLPRRRAARDRRPDRRRAGLRLPGRADLARAVAGPARSSRSRSASASAGSASRRCPRRSPSRRPGAFRRCATGHGGGAHWSRASDLPIHLVHEG